MLNERVIEPGRPRLFTANFTALLVAQTCFGYAFSSFFLLPTFMSRELGASATQIGWVMSLAAAGIVVFLPMVGMAASVSTDDDEFTNFPVPVGQGGLYSVRIVPFDGAVNTYDLDLQLN